MALTRKVTSSELATMIVGDRILSVMSYGGRNTIVELTSGLCLDIPEFVSLSMYIAGVIERVEMNGVRLTLHFQDGILIFTPQRVWSAKTGALSLVPDEALAASERAPTAAQLEQERQVRAELERARAFDEADLRASEIRRRAILGAGVFDWGDLGVVAREVAALTGSTNVPPGPPAPSKRDEPRPEPPPTEVVKVSQKRTIKWE